MAVVIERNECEACGEPEGMCMGHPSVQVSRRYTDERYLLELLKAAREVLTAAADGVYIVFDGEIARLEAAVLWVESDGLGPVAMSGQAQLELEAATQADSTGEKPAAPGGLCERVLVGRGTDQWDPLCGRLKGHEGRCE